MEDLSGIEEFSTEGWPVLTQELFAKVSNNREYSEDVREFYSSGGSKRVVLSPEDQRLVLEGYAETLREAGLRPDDVAINWGAPKEKDHMSQWVYEKGTEIIGAETVNESNAEDFEDYRDRWEEVTALLSLPRMLKSSGEQIQEEFGDLKETFPNLEHSITAGDIMPEELRDWIETNYGIKSRNFYAGTEIGGAAAEIEDGVYKPTNPNLILELLDEDAEMDSETGEVSEQDVYRLEELSPGETVTGPLLATMPLREQQPLIRYRIGDVWEVTGTEEAPEMKFKGREDDVIMFSGANVYPEEINNAIGDDYKLVVSENDGFVKLNFFTPGNWRSEEIVDQLAEQNKVFGDWYQSGSMPIEAKSYSSRDELEEMLEEYEIPRDSDGRPEIIEEGAKTNRIAFEDSYNSQFNQ
ncbi:GH3 family domain-containing protein [Candidatus Nanohalococcus occultus]|uniref:Phenylacetate-CoA ligase n=1 Tax=Candidatus Nanohalococcus occultus TaxID=2978047 RepID=A0ABY8CDM1_9ARCH|nr:Phenylacetate-CoA ligase [Candidatus Nanohaloarchaeota archaeon SVXNc]